MRTSFPDEKMSGHAYRDDLTRGTGLALEEERGTLDEEESEVQQVAAEQAEGEGSHAPDDALGLYLRQMGAIPLLNREQELSLARRLETARSRYRKAALFSWLMLRRVVETFERVQAGKLPLDPTIDVVTSLNLSREKILARMPYNVKTLRALVEASPAEFRTFYRTGSSALRNRLRHGRWRQLRKAAILAEELSPRTELLEQWTGDLRQRAETMTALEQQIDSCGRSRAHLAERTKLVKQLRDLTLQTQATREELSRHSRPAPCLLPAGAAGTGRGQPPFGGRHCQALPKPGTGLRRPDSGRQSRADAGGR
jgi:RNA polymerase primary sigma factor